MKNLIVLLAGITLIGGIILSLISGSWAMLAAAVILMGSAFVISYLGSILALAGDESVNDEAMYQHVCINK